MPEDLNALELLINGIEIDKYGKNLVDFEPIVIKDVVNNTVTIESYNKARDIQMIANLIKHRPELIEQPKNECINKMIQQAAWKFFDDVHGPSYFDKKLIIQLKRKFGILF